MAARPGRTLLRPTERVRGGDRTSLQSARPLPRLVYLTATLPRYLSRWLRADLPHKAERRFGLPVTTIITRRWP